MKVGLIMYVGSEVRIVNGSEVKTKTLTCRATQIMRMMGDQKKQRQR